MRRSFALVAVGLPLLLVVAGILRAEHHLRTSRVWHFEVTGYDPRDLLSGHYLRFRIVLGVEGVERACRERGECCLCLGDRGATQPPEVALASCDEARSACDGVVRTDRLAEIERFYVPEEHAAVLEERLAEAQEARRARVLLSISADGHPQVSDLWIDGRPVADLWRD